MIWNHRVKRSDRSSEGEGEQARRTHLVHVHPFEGGLEQLEVVKVLVLQLGLKLDLFKTDAAGEQEIHELAVGSSCGGTEPDSREAEPGTQAKGSYRVNI